MTNQKENFSTTQTLNHSTSTNTTVSVIMNCLNGEKYLNEAIDSVYAQTYKDWEIIFWDNASTDSSAEIARSYDERLRYFKGEETIPLGAARNKALKNCRGEYVAVLDCDDVWFPAKLKKQMSLFQKNPEIAVVYSACQTIDSNGCALEKTKWKFYRGMIFDDLLRHHFIPPSCTIVMKRKYIHAVGAFSKYSASIDFDLLLKLAFRYPFDFVDEILALYRMHNQAISFDYEGGYMECCEILEGWKKHPVCQSPSKAKLINSAIGRTFYIRGVYGIVQNKDAKKARMNLYKSMRIAPSLKTLIFLLINIFNIPRMDKIMVFIRKTTGRGIISR